MRLVGKPARPHGAGTAGGRGLDARVARVKRGLYDLYDELSYFVTCAPEHRERLRRALHWPDVGHVTSLARALAEEGRFGDWVRFNRLVKSA